MVRLTKPVGLVAILPLLGIAGSSAVTRETHADNRCHRVHGTINSVVTTENCTSPVGLCTAGTVTGGGPLDGATTFQALDVAPAAGLGAVEPAANLSFSGQLTITAKRGTLVTRDLGVLDAVNGFFTELERPTSGTGVFTNPSHDFFISGVLTDNGDGFSSTISGTLCTDGDLGDE